MILEKIKALSEYYKKPNRCKHCGNVIHVELGKKISKIKIKKFCNNYCSSQSRVILKTKKEKHIRPILSLDKTKGYYKEKYTNNWWLSRVPIAKAAKKVYYNSDKVKKCSVCGYDKHFEICHIKPVSDFEDSATLKEINNIDNLVALCRNCHWEFDNKLIRL